MSSALAEEIRKALDALTGKYVPMPVQIGAELELNKSALRWLIYLDEQNQYLHKTTNIQNEANERITKERDGWKGEAKRERDLVAELRTERDKAVSEVQRLSSELEQVKKERDAWEKSSLDLFSESFPIRAELAAKDEAVKKIIEAAKMAMNNPEAIPLTLEAIKIKCESVLFQYAKEANQDADPSESTD